MKTNNQNSTRRISRSSKSTFPWKSVTTFGGIIILIVVVILLIGPVTHLFKSKDGKATIKFEYTSSLVTGNIKHVQQQQLYDSILNLVMLGNQISIVFEVENGTGNYSDKFEISDTIQKISQTQDRANYFRFAKIGEFNSKIAAYEKALQAIPLRAFAIGIDVTEGYSGTFHFADYIAQEDVSWLSDTSKKSILSIFAIGYNPIPGSLIWNDSKLTIDKMEKEIQIFLEPVKKPLDSTALLSQFHYILNSVSTYNQPLIIIASDMLENTKDLSAYRPNDQAYKDFVSKKNAYMNSYLQKCLTAAETTLNPKTTGVVKILLPKEMNTVFGRQTGSQPWYTAIEYYLQTAYPHVKFTMGYQ